ncbi:hypothetical protein KR222_005187 [Zaprionus bogoriensis]|nr:hypothetical protein KR222_005187 [Zaprionus bogoriensis]
MPKPLVNSCCLCQTTRNGSVISGILAIVLSILTIIVIFTTRVQFKTFIFDSISNDAVKIILVINLCMTILISLLMIAGVLKRNHYLMVPWVVLGIMIAIGLFISIIYTSIVCFIDGFVLTGVVFLIGGLICSAVLTYCWCVVFSEYANLSEESERGRYNKQPYRR